MTDWDAIVANDGPAIWRILWRLLANREDVEECFQDTFLAAFRLSCRQTVDCWPAMLCSLATARGMDRLRKRYRRGGRRDEGGNVSVGVRLAEPTSRDAGPAEHAVAVELSERLRHSMSRLPKKQAELFYLHALCGWSHHELGTRFRMSDNAVGVTIHRARQRLRELLGDTR